ncbi:MAG: undecaprenyldiphospho-muramoylpentapeptide beta-N-acetylglucosaminyltransferase [Acidobacteriota bacterium]|nr:undecaprenyldiphospho-muramoylpentapeptide beta-N-acetylglucosaminyltransferase [Acidobacteriota bacterium]
MRQNQSVGIRVLLAGGGTGGHVFPALAVADELRSRGCFVSWLGRSDGMERNLVVGRGIDFHVIRARPWLGRGAGQRAGALVTLGRSALQARRLIRRSGVAVTVGTGGYVSAPAIVGSYLARLPVLLLEPNARAGTANRWLSRLSAVACTSYEETGQELACRSVCTGVPVRPEFFCTGELSEGELSLLVVGGSQGALQINRLLPPVVEGLAQKLPELRVVHQVGGAHLAAVEQEYARHRIGDVRLELVPFIDDMATAMKNAHVVVSRAGALTLAEVAAAGRPAILIPLAAAGGHQAANAERLKTAGAAEVVEPPATVERLEELLAALLSDRPRQLRMASAARHTARADAAERIADLVTELGGAE